MTTRPFNARPRVQHHVEGKSRTQQSFRDLTDINRIMSRWQTTGEIDHVNPGTPLYGDFSGAVDYQSSIHLIQAANDSFDALPSDLRARFENNPDNLISFIKNPENNQAAIDLDLLPGEKTRPPAPSETPPPAPETGVESPSVDKP